MADEFELNRELEAAAEPEVTPSAARDVSDEAMAEAASQVTEEAVAEFASRANKELDEAPLVTPRDIVFETIFFIVVAAVAFGWLMLMLLIISFVSLGYLHFNIRYMIVASVIFAVVVAIGNGIRIARKYTKLYNERERRRTAVKEK